MAEVTMVRLVWTQEDVYKLNYKLAGKTIKRIELVQDGCINFVTTDADEAAKSGVEEKQK